MLDNFTMTELAGIASTFATLAGAYLTFRKIQKDHREDRELHKAEILQSAFEADVKIRTAIDARIEMLYKDREAKLEAIRTDLANFKYIVDNELSHIREKQAGEIRVLGEKIEDLRTELRSQHGQLISLVSKLVEKS